MCVNSYLFTPICLFNILLLLHSSPSCIGVVIPVNARILCKNLEPLIQFLQDTSTCQDKVQLLVWTGSGEPPISNYLLRYLKLHFEAQHLSHRVGYDCQV